MIYSQQVGIFKRESSTFTSDTNEYVLIEEIVNRESDDIEFKNLFKSQKKDTKEEVKNIIKSV